MAFDWPTGGASGSYITITVNTLGAVSQGEYTIIGLILPKSSRGCLVGMQISGSYDRQIIIDSSTFYGGSDFSGYTPSGGIDTSGTKWQWVGQRKSTGTQTYDWSYRNYTDGGTITHTTGAGGTHADSGSPISVIRIGQGDNEARNGVAVLAIWKRRLSDSEMATAMGSTASAIMGLTPDALLLCNVAGPSSLIDSSGNGNGYSSVTGGANITTISDPAGYDFSIGGTPISSTDTGALDDSVFKIRVSSTDTLTVDDSTSSIRLADTDSIALSEAFKPGPRDTDSGSLAEANAIRILDVDTASMAEQNSIAAHATDTDSAAFAEANGIRLADSDSVLTSEGNGVRLADTDGLTLSEQNGIRLSDLEAWSLGDIQGGLSLVDIETLQLFDATFAVRLYGSDPFGFSESESVQSGGTTPSSSDLFTLSEAERITVKDLEGITLGDTTTLIRLADVDAVTLSEVLVRAGLGDVDAGVLADAVTAASAKLSDIDSFTVAEFQQVSSGSIPYPTMPIVISIAQPQITIRLGAPQMTITLE